MKALAGIIILLLIAGPARAEDVAFPKTMKVALPQDGSVKMEWIAPPLREAQVRKSGLFGQRFRLDARGRVWMGHDQKYLTDLSSGFSFSLDRKVEDFIFLDDNALFIIANGSLGLVAPFDAKDLSLKKAPEILFQPVCRLPLEKCGLASDGRERIFIYGLDPKSREYAIYELLQDFSGWKKIFVSDQRIFAAAADKEAVYAAAGRTVCKIPLKAEGQAKVVFSHPLETVVSLSILPGTGVFYATSSGLGLIGGQGAVEFIKSPLAQSAAQDEKLYVFLPDTLGVLRLSKTGNLLGSNR